MSLKILASFLSKDAIPQRTRKRAEVPLPTPPPSPRMPERAFGKAIAFDKVARRSAAVSAIAALRR